MVTEETKTETKQEKKYEWHLLLTCFRVDEPKGSLNLPPLPISTKKVIADGPAQALSGMVDLVAGLIDHTTVPKTGLDLRGTTSTAVVDDQEATAKAPPLKESYGENALGYHALRAIRFFGEQSRPVRWLKKRAAEYKEGWDTLIDNAAHNFMTQLGQMWLDEKEGRAENKNDSASAQATTG